MVLEFLPFLFQTTFYHVLLEDWLFKLGPSVHLYGFCWIRIIETRVVRDGKSRDESERVVRRSSSDGTGERGRKG